jgi:hypothetical protein
MIHPKPQTCKGFRVAASSKEATSYSLSDSILRCRFHSISLGCKGREPTYTPTGGSGQSKLGAKKQMFNI